MEDAITITVTQSFRNSNGVCLCLEGLLVQTRYSALQCALCIIRVAFSTVEIHDLMIRK